MSKDGKTLYPILEGALTTDTDKTLRRVYEFDVAKRAYTGKSWSFHAGADGSLIGDAQVLAGKRILFIERDDLQGAEATVKVLERDRPGRRAAADGTLASRLVLDLLRIPRSVRHLRPRPGRPAGSASATRSRSRCSRSRRSCRSAARSC